MFRFNFIIDTIEIILLAAVLYCIRELIIPIFYRTKLSIDENKIYRQLHRTNLSSYLILGFLIQTSQYLSPQSFIYNLNPTLANISPYIIGFLGGSIWVKNEMFNIKLRKGIISNKKGIKN